MGGKGKQKNKKERGIRVRRRKREGKKKGRLSWSGQRPRSEGLGYRSEQEQVSLRQTSCSSSKVYLLPVGTERDTSAQRAQLAQRPPAEILAMS